MQRLTHAMETEALLGGYRIERLIARGGMGAVYLAEHVRLKRKVALKVLPPDLAEESTYRERFIRESELAASIDHPNVIPIHDANEDGDVLYIAMRYVEGSDLNGLLKEEGQLSAERTLDVIAQVAAGLDAAHDCGLVHRDVKPGNVLIEASSNRVYVTDFGVAKPTSAAGITRTGFFLGTIDYCAPEQIEGRPVDQRTDVYALGCLLFQCLRVRA